MVHHQRSHTIQVFLAKRLTPFRAPCFRGSGPIGTEVSQAESFIA
jgi:hypothetical protein